MNSTKSIQATTPVRNARKAKRAFPRKPRTPRARVPRNNNTLVIGNQTVVDIRGSELVYTMGSLPNPNLLTTIIPSNPRYNQTAVRLYNAARSYQQWRPISVSLEWVPTCPTTSTGMVTIGTNWNTPTPAANSQAILMASNGGIAGAVYTKLISRPQLNGRMSQQWYYFNDMAEDSNPFSFAVINNLASSGFFRVHYHYQFCNPTTQLFSYTTSIGNQNITNKADSTFITLLNDVTLQTGGVDRVVSALSNLVTDKIYKNGVLTPIVRFLSDIYEFKDGIDYTSIPAYTLFRS